MSNYPQYPAIPEKQQLILSKMCGRPISQEQIEALIAKIISRCEVRPNGCWEWLGLSRTGNGYGFVCFAGTNRIVHRISYALFTGSIPGPGLVLDHICRCRTCINPNHLRAVTTRENVTQNSISVVAINAAKTHCKHGHELTPENLYQQRSGERTRRVCRECALAKLHRRWRKRNPNCSPTIRRRKRLV
jgi:hypothetical protein